MRLTELQAEFVKRTARGFRRLETIAAANGVFFLCPKCFRANGGDVGTHWVLCWSPSVPQTVKPTPGRWELRGTSLEDLTLVAGSSSILLTGGCQWHGFIRNGEVTDS